jgi:hypothetical protein
MNNLYIYNSLKEAADNVLQVLQKLISVDIFCVTSIKDQTSHFISVFNRKEELIHAGDSISLFEAY